MVVGAGGFQLGTGGESALVSCEMDAKAKNAEVVSAKEKVEKILFTVSPFL